MHVNSCITFNPPKNSTNINIELWKSKQFECRVGTFSNARLNPFQLFVVIIASGLHQSYGRYYN